MSQPVVVEQSRAIPVTAEAAFAGALEIPLPTLLHRRHGPFPPIKTVQGQTHWAHSGDSRIVVPAGGGSMRETLTAVNAPQSFGYVITEIAGPMALLVSQVDGLWTFHAQGAGTRVSWRWTLHPSSTFTTPLVRVLGWLWDGYARQALESLSDYLVR
jgi:hypothetical protein